jgi:hypothetical protein
LSGGGHRRDGLSQRPHPAARGKRAQSRAHPQDAPGESDDVKEYERGGPHRPTRRLSCFPINTRAEC